MALAQNQRLGSLLSQQRAALSPIARPSAAANQRQVRAQANPARVVPKWPEVYRGLVSKKLSTIPPEAASKLLAKGNYAFIDVRLPKDHEKSHPEGSVSVPMYQTITTDNLDATKLFKFIAYSFNGVNPVEPNPAFVEEVRAAMKGKKGLIVFCEAGGTLRPTVSFPEGKASRSLQAAFRILNEGIATEVLHLERGAYGWFQAGLPFVGEYAPDLGRTPMAAAEPMLQNINQAVGYELRANDKQEVAAPEPKNKLWPW